MDTVQKVPKQSTNNCVSQRLHQPLLHLCVCAHQLDIASSCGALLLLSNCSMIVCLLQTQSTEQNKLKNARRNFEGYRASPQDLLNEVLLKAGFQWHELLEVPLDIGL